MKPACRYSRALLPAWLLAVALVTTALSAGAQVTIDFGKSYINLNKGSNGGTVEPGDTLEIRASIVVGSSKIYDSCAFYDVVPTGTTFVPGSLRVITNEGKTYKQFTDAFGDDEGWISGSNVRINLGYKQANKPATAFRRGRITASDKPSFYSGTCIMVASYRVVVTSALGSFINTGGGSMTYKNGSNPVQTFTFPSNTVAIYKNYGICPNSVGVNALGTEFNGTFGSGTLKDRGASANVPTGYTYKAFTSNTPNDYSYGVSNNTSAGTTAATGYSTSNAWAIPDNSTPTHRVFNVWDIIGDHTGASNLTAGNPPADTATGGGYMLIVNAAYRIDSAFVHTISGLCPNTYYEISCWMRNICSKCGCDSNGKGATGGAGYIPTAPGDSSGVHPNITFEVDGVDYYTTGDLPHTGNWVKKGFTYLTGPSQSSFTLKFFNNAPGGGGNDWALDDITVATCSPNFTFTPTANPTVCDSNVINMGATVSSYFSNYVYFKWQKSVDNGATWYDTGVQSPPTGSPTWDGSNWVYSLSYPQFVAYQADSGSRYKLVVATTNTNLSNTNCQLSDASTVITLNVQQCGPILKTRLISFTGRVEGQQALLSWTTTSEDELLNFQVEKSTDGMHFSPVAVVPSHGDFTAQLNQYSFRDPDPISGRTFYRIKLSDARNQVQYSRTIALSGSDTELNLVAAISPFQQSLDFFIHAPAGTLARVELISLAGIPVRSMTTSLVTGTNRVSLPATGGLPDGAYILRVSTPGKVLSKSVLKLAR
ncbi:MAG TPA: T9SS type A sorting domain-containing protein [Chitinophagaceae bacterium]|nr:T9SS type A sorting domain-containing protein [Chitinophagaceae bacterium]